MSALIPLAIQGGLSAVSIAAPFFLSSSNQPTKAALNPNSNDQTQSFLTKNISFNAGNTKVSFPTWGLLAIIAIVLLLVIL